jgi:hypothetical protein
MRVTLRALAVLFLLANVKALPGVWHLRFFYLFIKHFMVRYGIRPGPKDVFRANDYRTHTPLLEMDMNFHKSNSTYFSDLDMGRADLLMDVFKQFFFHYRRHKGSWPFVPLGSVMTIFKKELKAYKPYTVRSRILGWDEKWLFVLSRFEFLDAKRTLVAVSLSKYVFKHNRRTVPPEEALKICGLDTPEVLNQGRTDFSKAKNMLQLEALGDEWDSDQ